MMWHFLSRELNPQSLGFAVLLLVIGTFTFFCAWKDYDWYMMSSKAALFRLLLGRPGARIVYMLLGVVFIGLGVLTGWLSLFGG